MSEGTSTPVRQFCTYTHSRPGGGEKDIFYVGKGLVGD